MLHELENQSFSSLVFAGALLALTACGSNVNGFGSGGGGAGGNVDGEGPCSPAETCNPPQCPMGLPSDGDECAPEGLACSYSTLFSRSDARCTVTLECVSNQGTGAGGYGGSYGTGAAQAGGYGTGGYGNEPTGSHWQQADIDTSTCDY